ncbi:MAG: polysaccharide biosynthesis protein [Lysobacter sp.]|nr:polysaccharide biosynthesis protein [Lysobacter sp.]
MTLRARTLRNTLFSSVAMYTEFALGMLTSIVIARHLGPEGFGAYSAVIWLVGMGVAATNSGTASAAIKFVAELRGGGRESLVRPLIAYLRRAQRLFLAAVLLVGAMALWLAGHRVAPDFHHGMLFVFLVVAVSLRAGYMFNIGVAKGLENFRINAMVALLSTPLNLAMVMLVMWFDMPVEWLLGVFLVSSVVFYTMSLAQVRPLLPPGEDRPSLPEDLVPRVRRQMLYSTLIVTVGFMAASEIEVLFLTAYADPHAAGQFKVGYQLASGATTLVPGVFGALLLPMMANALSQGREVAGRRFAASTAYLALLALPLVAFGVVLAKPLIGLLYGSEYDEAAAVFAVCLAGTAIATSAQGGSSLLISADRQRAVLIMVICFGVLKLALDAWLIRVDGLHGAMIAFFTVSIFNAIAYVTMATRVSGISPDWARILRTLLASVLAVLPLWPLVPHLQAWAALLAGAVIGGALYLPLTLSLGCWTRNDIAHMQQLHQRLLKGQPRFGARLLSWAHARAGVPV